MKKILLLIILLHLNACSDSTKQKLGMIKTTPDEFQVISYKSLTIPKNFSLKQPGSQNNLNDSISELSFISDNDVPISPSDSEFLKLLHVTNNQSSIREIVDNEYAQQQKKQNIVQKIVAKINPDNRKYVDPVAEKERLRLNKK